MRQIGKNRIKNDRPGVTFNTIVYPSLSKKYCKNTPNEFSSIEVNPGSNWVVNINATTKLHATG